MNTLRLVITPDWPREDATAAWLLLAADGRVLQRGRSEPRHWPVSAADDGVLRREAALTGSQVTIFEADLPAGRAARDSRVIGYAIEDRLLGEPEDYHFVAADAPLASGRTRVLAVERWRLEELVATFAGLRQPVDGIYACGEWLGGWERDAADWLLWLRADACLLRVGTADLALPPAIPAEPSMTLLSLAETLRPAPRRLTLLADGIPCDAAPWRDALGIDVDCRMTSPLEANRPGEAVNLLQGEFAPVRRLAGSRQWRPAALAASLFAALYIAVSLGEWAWLAWRARILRGELAAEFAAALPRIPLVDAPLQVQRAADGLRHQRGQLGSGDFLSLVHAMTMAAPAPTSPAIPAAITYANETLRISQALAADKCDALVQGLRALDLATKAEITGSSCQIDLRARGGA